MGGDVKAICNECGCYSKDGMPGCLNCTVGGGKRPGYPKEDLRDSALNLADVCAKIIEEESQMNNNLTMSDCGDKIEIHFYDDSVYDLSEYGQCKKFVMRVMKILSEYEHSVYELNSKISEIKTVCDRYIYMVNK